MQSKKSFRHPAILYHLAYTYAFLTFAYGMINSLLVLYLRTQLNFGSDASYGLFAAFNALVFALPVLGGYLAEQLGYKTLTNIGMVLCIIGAALLSHKALWSLYTGLSAFAFGLAICATTLYCFVDFTYEKDSSIRHSAFTLFYLLFNIGFLLSTFSGGFIAEYFGYTRGFEIATVSSILSLLSLSINIHRLHAAKGRSFAPTASLTLLPRAIISLILSICTVGGCVILLMHIELNSIFLWAFIAISVISILFLATKQKTKVAKLKLFAFLILSFLSIAFWSLYTLEPSLLTVFIENNVNRNIFGFTVPASTFYSLDSINVIVFGIVLSFFWRHLAKKGKDISLPVKFTLSLFSMGCGYWLFIVGIKMVGATHLINATWIVVGYWFLSLGELLIAPIGLAMVGRLSPPGKEGLLMGIWQLFVGLSAVISGYLADLAATPKQGMPIETNPIYAHALFQIGLFAIIISGISLCLVPLIKKLIK